MAKGSVDPYYFCFACLVSGEPDATDDELHVVENGKHRSLTGTPVSSLYHLKDLDNNDAAFFVFPDLGVRKEGRYRLKMTVYEIVESVVSEHQSGRHADGIHSHRYVHFCDSIFTDSFTVYSAKKWVDGGERELTMQIPWHVWYGDGKDVADDQLRLPSRKLSKNKG